MTPKVRSNLDSEEIGHLALYVLKTYQNQENGTGGILDHYDAVLSFFRYVFPDATLPESAAKQPNPYLPETVEEVVNQLNDMKTRLYPLIDFAVAHCEYTDQTIENQKDKTFAEVMLVTLRDVRDQILDIRGLMEELP